MTNEIDKAPGYCGICGPLSEGKGRCELHDSRYGYDPATGADQTVEINYQLKGEGVEVASITDKPDTKNTRGDWFNTFGGQAAHSLGHYQAALDDAQRQIFNMATELRVLRQACKDAGDEIRELHAQRKPEQHGAYWLTFPECGTSRGMYWAMAGLLSVGGLLLAWWLA
jgi:hypothetical protein